MRPSTLRNAAVAALVAAVAIGSLTPAFAKPGKRQGPKAPNPHKVANQARRTARQIIEDYSPTCVGDPSSAQALDLVVNGQATWGVYAMPSHEPKGIVVFGHGYGHGADGWRKHVADVATRDGVVAVAMNYRGQTADNRGWRVQEGAEDSIAAAQLFQRACPTAKTIVMYGVSMGGNTAGLAVAAKAKRSNGSALFDYLFDIEGATTVVETYFEARGLAGSGNAFAKNAVVDIEQEMGGAFEKDAPTRDRYLNSTVLNRVADIAASGIKGVVMVQGVDDGLVGYNQSPEFFTRLRSAGVKVDFWTALTKGSKSESGTTLDGYVTGNVPGFESPFAGHANEESDTHIVGAAGFTRLDALFAGTTPACRVGILDGTAGFTTTSGATTSATC